MKPLRPLILTTTPTPKKINCFNDFVKQVVSLNLLIFIFRLLKNIMLLVRWLTFIINAVEITFFQFTLVSWSCYTHGIIDFKIFGPQWLKFQILMFFGCGYQLSDTNYLIKVLERLIFCYIPTKYFIIFF